MDCVDISEVRSKLKEYDIFNNVEDEGFRTMLEYTLDESCSIKYTFFIGNTSFMRDLERVMGVIFENRYKIAKEYSDALETNVDDMLYAIGLKFDGYNSLKDDLVK